MSEAERVRLRNIIEEKDQYIADLEAQAARHRESTQGLNTLKQARHKVWTQICDVVEKGWNQLLKYQELKEQVVNANQKLRQLDHEMENRVDTAKTMLAALENLSNHELAVIGIENRITQMRNIHKILRKVALVDETRTLVKELSMQCHNYRARFDKCLMLGLPSIFAGTGDSMPKMSICAICKPL